MSRAKESGLIRILPGVTDLLERLTGQPDFCIGLVTGNLEQGALYQAEKCRTGWIFSNRRLWIGFRGPNCLTRIGIQRGTRIIAPDPVEGVFVLSEILRWTFSTGMPQVPAFVAVERQIWVG